MLVIEDVPYHEEVLAFAEKVGKKEDLEKNLKYLDEYRDKITTRCKLYKDSAPYSYGFVMERLVDGVWKHWFNGGLIFHGKHDGYGSGSAPTFSVTLTPTDGWQIHT